VLQLTRRRLKDAEKAASFGVVSSPDLAGADASTDSKQLWLDQEIEKHVSYRRNMEQLERELRAREAKLIEREDAERQLQALQAKQLRGSFALRSSMVGLKDALDAVNGRLNQAGMNQGSPGSRAALASLASEKAQLQTEITALSARVEDGEFLSVTENGMLRELSQRIEAIDAEVAMRNEHVQSLTAEVSIAPPQLPPSSGLHSASLTLGDAKLLLQRYVDEVAVLRAGEAQLGSECRAMKERLLEATQTIEELSQHLRGREAEYEHELQRLKASHQLKVTSLMKDVAMSPSHGGVSADAVLQYEKKIKLLEEQTAMIDKDNYYYKHANKDLKAALKEQVLVTEGIKSQVATAVSAREQLQQYCSQLENEITNLKGFLSRTNVTQTVRLSSRELRPLSAHEVRHGAHVKAGCFVLIIPQVRQKIQTSSRDGPIVPVDLESSSASNFGAGRSWRVARSNDTASGAAGGVFAGVPDDFDHR
jgi:chromosome segregation ATPase